MSAVAYEVVLILVLILANGVFALSEMAVVSSRRPRLQQRADEGDASAAAALRLVNDPGDFLSAVQIGITLIGILAGAFGGATLARQLALALGQIPWLAPYAESASLILVVIAIAFLSLVFGELVPKRLALNNPERIAAGVARPMRVLAIIAMPLVRLITGTTELVLRLLRVKPSAEPPVTEEEIKVMVSMGAEAGVIAETAQNLVSNIFRLGDLRVSAIMKPRTEVDWLDLEDPPDEVRRKVTASPYSRMPVARGNLDNVLGVVQAKDLLGRCLGGEPLVLQAALRPAIFLPEAATALQLLETFKSTGETMCLVIDEYGGSQGLVTATDVLEAVVGDLGMMGEPNQPRAVQREDGSWLVDGLMQIDELRETIGLDRLPGGEDEGYETLGGFMMAHLERIPSVADHFETGGVRFEVVDMDERRVDKVLITPIEAQSPDTFLESLPGLDSKPS
jgi:putative hemolysin